MASLPLFSPSFLPKDGASFASSRHEAAMPAAMPSAERDDAHSTRYPAPDSHAQVESRLEPGSRSPSPSRPDARSTPAVARVPLPRSLFDPLPSPGRSGSPSKSSDGLFERASNPPSGRREPPSPKPSIGHDATGPVPATDPCVPSPSTVERTEAALREAGLAGRFWRGDALSASPLASTPSGFRALDEQLPDGGWPARCLTELLLSHVGMGEIRFLAATLASLTQAGREIVLLGPPHIPDPTGWEQLGIDMRRVLIVRTERPADRLWALEQSLKSSAFGALVAWLPEEKTPARHDALRRLQLAAASANGLTFLMRPAAAQYRASPAPLRLTLAAGQPAGHRRTLSVRLLKRRGPVMAAPLTLALPEIHRGMKAFSRVAQGDSMPASLPLPPSSPATGTKSTASSPTTTSTSMASSSCDQPRLSSSTTTDPTLHVADALAGALLSDAGA